MKVKSLTESLERLIENKYVDEKEPSNLLEAIDNILGKLNEAEMSPEDAKDTELLKSARHKIAGKNSNVKNLTPEEQEVLKKYGLDAWGFKGETKVATPGHKDIFRGQEARGWGRSNSDRFSEPKDSWNGRTARSYQGGNYDKVNFADRARKIDSRIENQPYRDLEAARHTDELNMRAKNGIGRIKHAKDSADYHTNALKNLEAEEAEMKKRADDKYEKTHKDIERSLEWQYSSRDKAQDKIDQILNKHRKEVVESLQHFLRTLNEANMSDEDRRDSDVIKDITYKLMKRRNAKLTDEEKAILDKYNLVQSGNRLKTSNHTIMPKPDDQLPHKKGDELETNAYDNSDDKFAKMNLADFARKADSRDAKRRSISRNDWSDDYRATNHDKANFEHSYNRGSTQRQRKIQQTADMTKDYDDMSRALEDRKYANAAIDHEQKELSKASYARHTAKKQAEERTVQQRKYHTDKAAEYNAEKDRLIAAKKAEFNKKDESLNEAADENVRIVTTGLSGDLGKEIIDSIIGQMSDGIWENSPAMESYWPFVNATENGDIEVSTDWHSRWSNRENKFRSMSDQEVRKFFANKLKTIAQEYLNDNNMNPYTEFRADNEEECGYLGGHVVPDVTIGQAYDAYNTLRR